MALIRMENFSNTKALQAKSVQAWLEIVRAAAQCDPEPGETISPETIKSRHEFCEVLAPALIRFINRQQGDENGLIYGLVAMSQIYGMWVAFSCADHKAGFNDVIDAGRHMINAFHATFFDESKPVMVGAIH